MLPHETILATIPATVEFRGVVLRPVTLLHATVMDALGFGTTYAVGRDKALLAGWVLSLTPEDAARAVIEATFAEKGFGAFAKAYLEAGGTPGEMAEKVNSAVSQAYVTFVPGKQPADEVSIAPGGYGWTLEYAEALCAEYGWGFDEAMRTPLVRVFALAACARSRNGAPAGGPDYYERRMLAALKARDAERAKEQTDG